jgi:DNA modification methylase
MLTNFIGKHILVMKKIIWRTEVRTVDELIPQKINPRKITDAQMSALKKSLKKFGLAEIPCLNKNGTILAGHQRIRALQLLGRGDEKIDVRVPSRQLTKKEADQYLIGSNKLGGDFDYDLLKEFDIDLLTDAGFESIELASFWDDEKEATNDTFDVEKELQKIKKPTTKLGDIIHLGKHKIICGDCTKLSTLQKLYGTERASMIASDPPYNVGYNYSSGLGGKSNYGAEVHDNRTYKEYENFITKSLESALSVSAKDAHVFMWSDQIYIGLIQGVYRKLGLNNKRVCLWLKNVQNPVPQVAFNKVYEPCTYGTRGKPYLAEARTDLNEVMNKEATTGNDLLEQFIDIWAVKRLPAQQYSHATSKPPELHQKAILRCTKPNDIILDSFLGSGSTLIAAEQLDRRVFGCELEPVFCDLIINRFEKLTGIKAIVERL